MERGRYYCYLPYPRFEDRWYHLAPVADWYLARHNCYLLCLHGCWSVPDR